MGPGGAGARRRPQPTSCAATGVNPHRRAAGVHDLDGGRRLVRASPDHGHRDERGPRGSGRRAWYRRRYGTPAAPRRGRPRRWATAGAEVGRPDPPSGRRPSDHRRRCRTVPCGPFAARRAFPRRPGSGPRNSRPSWRPSLRCGSKRSRPALGQCSRIPGAAHSPELFLGCVSVLLRCASRHDPCRGVRLHRPLRRRLPTFASWCRRPSIPRRSR